MSKRRFLGYFTLLLLVALLVWGARFALSYVGIATSYAAKTVCSCVYVSGREARSVLAEDLYAVDFVEVRIDSAQQLVRAHYKGLAEAVAVYRPGLGCTLVNGTPLTGLRQLGGLALPAAEPDTLALGLLPANIDSLALDRALGQAFAEPVDGRVMRTRAVVVLYGGRLVAERYGPGIDREMPLLGWSMTKSVTNAMIGRLVQLGKLNITQPAPLAEWQNDDRRQITTDHLLRMSSGLAFEEDYGGPSDATKMLFREPGAGAYALASAMVAQPGQQWNYSSGTSNILQEIIRRQFAQLADYQRFPHEQLFRKIGMRRATLEPDASGTYVGSSFMYATARDWARFGQLFLQDGMWNGERLLPEGWARYSATETPHSDGRYAAHFWIDHVDKSFPQDAYMALGFEAQSVTVVPSKSLVVVRLGCTPNDDFDRVGLLKGVLGAIK
jgi:CubicO group peptidase (beta-lactamase class C family)